MNPALARRMTSRRVDDSADAVPAAGSLSRCSCPSIAELAGLFGAGVAERVPHVATRKVAGFWGLGRYLLPALGSPWKRDTILGGTRPYDAMPPVTSPAD